MPQPPDATFTPFADDTTAVSIGGLTLENGKLAIPISGSLTIEHDQTGLKTVTRLIEHLTRIKQVLEADADSNLLPDTEQAEEQSPGKRVKNPFE